MLRYVNTLFVIIVMLIQIPAISDGIDTSSQYKSIVSKEVLYGFYKYDEKYKGSVAFDKKSFNAWIEEKVNKISTGEQVYNLFGKHNGGGPGGAEWNSDADIIGIIYLPFNTDIINKIDIFINHEKVEISGKIKKSNTGKMYFIFELSSDFWNKRLHQIGENDYRYLYDVVTPEDKKNSNPEWLHSDGTNTFLIENDIVGECFIIETEIKYRKGVRKKLSGSFLIAYGE